METELRYCIRNCGSPDFIIASGKFIDTYRKQVTVTHIASSDETNYKDTGVGSGVNTGLTIKGVEIV